MVWLIRLTGTRRNNVIKMVCTGFEPKLNVPREKRGPKHRGPACERGAGSAVEVNYISPGHAGCRFVLHQNRGANGGASAIDSGCLPIDSEEGGEKPPRKICTELVAMMIHTQIYTTHLCHWHPGCYPSHGHLARYSQGGGNQR